MSTREQILSLNRVVDLVKNLRRVPSTIELVSVVLRGRALLTIKACYHRHLKDIVHVSHPNLPAPTRRDRPLLILFQSHMIILDCLSEITPLIFTSAPRISRINVIWIDLKDSCEVIDALLELPKFLEGTSSDVECTSVLDIKPH